MTLNTGLRQITTLVGDDVLGVPKKRDVTRTLIFGDGVLRA